MANLTITLKTQRLNVFGPSTSNKWLGGNWGTLTWGMKANSITGANAIIKGIGKIWTKVNSSVLTDAVTKGFNRHITILDTLKISYANSDTELFTANHYNYQFIDRVTNIESAAAGNIFTSAAAGSTTWSSAAAASTTWS